jgi:hypothetical protein
LYRSRKRSQRSCDTGSPGRLFCDEAAAGQADETHGVGDVLGNADAADRELQPGVGQGAGARGTSLLAADPHSPGNQSHFSVSASLMASASGDAFEIERLP